jgi:hypothetical protein
MYMAKTGYNTKRSSGQLQLRSRTAGSLSTQLAYQERAKQGET